MTAFPHIAGVLLAAGLSRRMGQPKPLVPLRGRPLCTYAAGALAGAGLGRLLVVVPPGEVGQHISVVLPDFEVVVNPQPERGLASSFRVAASALPAGQAALFMLADMPFVSAHTVQAVAQAFAAAGAPLVLTRYGEGTEAVTAPPHLFRADLCVALRDLPDADTGPRQLLRAYANQTVLVPRPAAELLDLDTPEALAAAEG